MKKRFATLLLLLATFFMSAVCVSATERSITVLLDGTPLTFDVDPIVENDRTLVPMRVIFEALGAKVDWNYSTGTAFAVKDDITIEVIIDSTQMLKNGEIINLDAPARLKNNRTLVPVRAISEAMGAKVDWNQELYQVVISSKSSYNYNELSPKDTDLLKSLLGSTRYNFEQLYLPALFRSEENNWSELISANSDTLLTAVPDLWEDLTAQAIIRIQTNSEDVYQLNTSDTDIDLIRSYRPIAENTGFLPDDMFAVTYEVTPEDRPVLLLSFKTADSLSNCRYIAVVSGDDGLRYFTAEKTFDESANIRYMFCEVEIDDGYHTDHTVIYQTKDAFLTAIDAISNADYAGDSDDEDYYVDKNDEDIRAVQSFVDKLAPALISGLAEQTGGQATMDMRAEETTVVMTFFIMDFSSDELESMGIDSLEDLVNQLTDSNTLYDTIKEEEPAVAEVMIELCGNDSRVVFSKSFS